jgi:hypothetical protein
MRVLIDFNGTMEGNLCGATLQETLQAALDIKSAGHEVLFMSGDPGSAETKLNATSEAWTRSMGGSRSGIEVSDKLAVLEGRLVDTMVIDDDYQILTASIRRGAVAVPAHRLLDVASALTDWYKIAMDNDGE